jgi:hypothetical protein
MHFVSPSDVLNPDAHSSSLLSEMIPEPILPFPQNKIGTAQLDNVSTAKVKEPPSGDEER